MNTNYSYNLGQHFKQIADRYGSNIAIRQTDGSVLDYYELNILSNKIAHHLLSKGVCKKDVVVVLNNKSNVAYAIMIACVKIGAIYSNLDPKSPIERFNRMLDLCSAKFLFHYVGVVDLVNESNFNSSYCTNYEATDWLNELAAESTTLPEENASVPSSNPAYIMFTSGSTGFPKGVVISHQNVLNFISWSRTTYQISPSDVFTNINPMHFDNSVFDFYSSLFTGASIVPVNETLTRNPRKLLDALNEQKPTVWFSVPSMLVYVLNMRALKDSDLPSLRVVIYGGEGFPKNQLRKLWKIWGNRVRFINVYGPTECTCICSSYEVTEVDMECDELLPLGHMAPNFYGMIMNDEGHLCAPDEVGELLIGGPNVGIGYYNNSEKTKEVFIQNPVTEVFDEIVYRSGDLVKQDPSTMMYHFCGRKDNQIKRMGYRIELEEIENAFNAINWVKESAVIYVDNEKYLSKIIACLSTDNKDEDKITAVLKKYLPSYMLPDLYFYFDGLPKNQNGKIDRLKLKEKLNT